jgi:hypothetical protein
MYVCFEIDTFSFDDKELILVDFGDQALFVGVDFRG